MFLVCRYQNKAEFLSVEYYDSSCDMQNQLIEYPNFFLTRSTLFPVVLAGFDEPFPLLPFPVAVFLLHGVLVRISQRGLYGTLQRESFPYSVKRRNTLPFQERGEGFQNEKHEKKGWWVSGSTHHPLLKNDFIRF